MNPNFTLYKYRDWKNPNHKSIVLSNELYIPTVGEINDPFDFKIPPDYTFLDTSEKQEAYILYLVESALPTLVKNQINIQNKIAELKIAFANQEHKKILEFEYALHTNSMIDRHYGICSFSKRWDSILMWTHYSTSHTGICLGFNSTEIEKLQYFGLWGAVEYRNEFPKINPLDPASLESMFIESHTKAKDWEYEQEYRFVKLWEPNPPSLEEKKLILTEKCISEIILGLWVDKESKNELISIAKMKNIPIFQITKTRREFRFERFLIKHD
ncbi:MAG: DUF2971 domain-containing protein [Bacteroidota bacterium]